MAKMSPAGASKDIQARDEILGHPKGLYICFFTEMWERFSFYGMKALLLLYLVKYHMFADSNGYNLLGAYGGLVYAVPVLGGLLAGHAQVGGAWRRLAVSRSFWHGLRGPPGNFSGWASCT